MRKLAIALATTAAVAATPALARDGAWYVGGEFGAMIVEDMDIDVGGVEDVIGLDHDYGYDGGVFAGYDMGSFRLEAEAAYKKADLEEIDSLIALPGGAVAGLRDAGGGNTSVMSFMANGMFDFGDDDGLSGFVGAGVGYAKVKVNNARAFSNQAPFLDDSDGGLAWQAFAGVRQAISDTVDVSVKYRFFNAPKVDMVAFNGAETETRFRSHSLLGGLTFNFGAPPPPPPPPPPVAAPPPPPPPPPPPAPQMQTCPNGQRIPVTQACPAPPPPPVPRTGERG